MSDIKPIDVTKPIETITGVPVTARFDGNEIMACETGLHFNNTLNRFGSPIGFPSIGPIIRNVQPTDAEIVAERLAKAATRPMKPTGLVTKSGCTVEGVSLCGTGEPIYRFSFRDDGTLHLRRCDYHGKWWQCSGDGQYDLLPAKDFIDE